jgi:hypothetical protein
MCLVNLDFFSGTEGTLALGYYVAVMLSYLPPPPSPTPKKKKKKHTHAHTHPLTLQKETKILDQSFLMFASSWMFLIQGMLIFAEPHTVRKPPNND